MDASLEFVQTCLEGVLVHVRKALVHPELELVLSLAVLASLAKQLFQDCPKNLRWVDFGDTWRALSLVAYMAWRACRTRLQLEVRNEHLQGLARTEFGVFHIRHQWRAPACPGKLLITSNFDASFLRCTPTRSHDCQKRLLLAEMWSLTAFFHFLASFLTFLHTLTCQSSGNAFSGIPRETKCLTTAHLPKDWSGFPVKSNGLPQLFLTFGWKQNSFLLLRNTES